MSNPTAYLAVAAMFVLRSVASVHALPSTREELASIFEKRYGTPLNAKAVDILIRQLDAWGCVTVIDDDYAGELLRLYAAKTDEALERATEAGHQPLVAKARAGGTQWFERVFSNPKFWDDLQNDRVPDAESTTNTSFDDPTIVPASDRVVTKSDNRREVDIIHSDMRSLAEEIATNNEISIELGDEKDLISGELQAAEVIVTQPSFRLSRLANLVLPALRYLAEKFANGAIGEMAKRLILAILGLS